MKKFIFILIFLFAFSLPGHAQNKKTGSISGEVLSVNGSPVRGIQIELRNFPIKKVKRSFFAEGRARIDNVLTDHTGKYEFKNLSGGNYYLSIRFPQKIEKVYEYSKKPVMPIKLNQEQDIKNADYTLKQIRSIMSGKVYKSNAVTPCANASMELFRDDKIYSSATTNENGEYVFVFEPAAGQWKVNVKDIDKTVSSSLNMDLSKINIFENINIICDK